MNAEKPIEISAEEFDRRFDDGEDMTPYLDFSKASHPNWEIKKVNVDMPAWMVNSLDHEAKRLNISRQAVIKTKLDWALKAEAASRMSNPSLHA